MMLRTIFLVGCHPPHADDKPPSLSLERPQNGFNRTYIDLRSCCTRGEAPMTCSDRSTLSPTTRENMLALANKISRIAEQTAVHRLMRQLHMNKGVTAHQGQQQVHNARVRNPGQTRRYRGQPLNTATHERLQRPGACTAEVSLHQREEEREGVCLARVPSRPCSSLRKVWYVTGSAGLTRPIAAKYIWFVCVVPRVYSSTEMR